jgi:hypothetical protein
LQLHFTDDAGEEPVELYHKLKLYGEDDPSGQASTKKPVSAWLLTLVTCSSIKPIWQAATLLLGRICLRMLLQVVSETYEELVFREPAETFYQRVANHMPVPSPPMSQAQWFTTFHPQEDLRKFSAARQRVAGMTASVQRQLEAA